eukprot:TRINITY_DN66765_c3_g4_i2.p1 TRINITY_DN66765_c3_g4~~TRINITY_DN66765_c3_g4_i2.p1  ORF type:complete len:234 (-),score=79.59 TRINITY_DN66765_c3_g4_i2:48-749(-)
MIHRMHQMNHCVRWANYPLHVHFLTPAAMAMSQVECKTAPAHMSTTCGPLQQLSVLRSDTNDDDADEGNEENRNVVAEGAASDSSSSVAASSSLVDGSQRHWIDSESDSVDEEALSDDSEAEAAQLTQLEPTLVVVDSDSDGQQKQKKQPKKKKKKTKQQQQQQQQEECMVCRTPRQGEVTSRCFRCQSAFHLVCLSMHMQRHDELKLIHSSGPCPSCSRELPWASVVANIHS